MENNIKEISYTDYYATVRKRDEYCINSLMHIYELISQYDTQVSNYVIKYNTDPEHKNINAISNIQKVYESYWLLVNYCKQKGNQIIIDFSIREKNLKKLKEWLIIILIDKVNSILLNYNIDRLIELYLDIIKEINNNRGLNWKNILLNETDFNKLWIELDYLTIKIDDIWEYNNTYYSYIEPNSLTVLILFILYLKWNLSYLWNKFDIDSLRSKADFLVWLNNKETIDSIIEHHKVDEINLWNNIFYYPDKYIFINKLNKKEYNIRSNWNYDILMDILIINKWNYVPYNSLLDMECINIKNNSKDFSKKINDSKTNLFTNVARNLELKTVYKFIDTKNWLRLP